MSTDTGARRLISIPEAQGVLGGLGRTTVYELVKRGDIARVKIGRRSFVTVESLESYIDRLGIAATAGGGQL